MLPWSGLYTRDWRTALLVTFAFVLLMVAHELGHAFVARWRGLAVDAIEVAFLHGRCLYEAPAHEGDDIWVAWGGILGQGILLLVAALMVLPFQGVPDWLSPLFAVLIPINLAIAVINLLPIAPLDGHIAWRVMRTPWARMRSALAGVWRRPSRKRRRLHAVAAARGVEDAEAIASDLIGRLKQRNRLD